MTVIGIDLGTTFSCLGMIENNRVEIVPNDSGCRTTPSWVSFDEEILVGDAAKTNGLLNPKNTIYDIKRLMGMNYDDKKCQQDIENLGYKVVEKENRPMVEVQIKEETKLFTPQEISAQILRKMKEIGEARYGGEVRDCVITVPAYFNDTQRQATIDAGRIAGLNVLRIINEPTAAAMAYGLDKVKPGEDKNILVFDCGGGTLDISVLNICDGVFEVLGTSGDTHCGGEDIDNLLIHYCLGEFQRENPTMKLNERSRNRLKFECERAKRTLSSSTNASIIIDSFSNGVDLNLKLTRAKLENICSVFFKKIMKPVDDVLKIAKTNKDRIDDIVLVGGTTRIPKVQKLLEEYFGKKPNSKINPDECVAYGATLQASILGGLKMKDTEDILLIDSTPLTLGIETSGEISTPLIPRGTTIPAKKTESFSTYKDDQPTATIKVLEGERYYSEENHLLGSFQLENLPKGRRGSVKINVTYDINADNILNVNAEVENEEGLNKSLTITNDKNRLSDEEIEKMKQDAEKYKKDDEKYRENREAVGKYEDTLVINLNTLRDKKILKELEKLYEDEILWIQNNSRISIEELNKREQEFKEKEKEYTKEKSEEDVKVEEVD